MLRSALAASLASGDRGIWGQRSPAAGALAQTPALSVGAVPHPRLQALAPRSFWSPVWVQPPGGATG